MGYHTDIHCHMLCGVDDGAGDENEMFAMLDTAYHSGTRRLCLTPHYNGEIWGDNQKCADIAFGKLCEYAADKYPDMQLFMGNEVFYSQDSIESINSGLCRTLNGGKYVLVDFGLDSSYFDIRGGLTGLLGSGYIPVFAHAERYPCIDSPFRELYELKELGTVIQLNSDSVSGDRGRSLQKKALKILKAGLADVIASDSHNLTTRPPVLDRAENVILKHFGSQYSEQLLKINPDRILGV